MLAIAAIPALVFGGILALILWGVFSGPGTPGRVRAFIALCLILPTALAAILVAVLH